MWRFQQKSLSHLAWPTTSWLYPEISYGEPQISREMSRQNDAGRCWAMLGAHARHFTSCQAPANSEMAGIRFQNWRIYHMMIGFIPNKKCSPKFFSMHGIYGWSSPKLEVFDPSPQKVSNQDTIVHLWFPESWFFSHRVQILIKPSLFACRTSFEIH